MLDKVVVGALREARDRESIDNIFNRFDIRNIDEKADYLVEAMHNPQLFFSNGEDACLQQKYELILQMFLTFSWKLYNYYEILGLTPKREKRQGNCEYVLNCVHC